MIVGISGKMNSGKDLVGKIIKVLTYQYYYKNLQPSKEKLQEVILQEILNNTNPYSDWKIVKFADKLKDIVCILLGCTREQLEDRVYKETELGEEWSKSCSLNNCDCCKEDKICKRKYKDNLYITTTPRKMLQFIGTDLFRTRVHTNTWVNATMADYKSVLTSNHPIDDLDWEPRFIYPNWIITDVRFPNEAQAIKERNGISIRIERNYETAELGRGKVIRINEHASETALDDYNFDYTIDNNGTVEDLIEKVKEILIKEKII